MTAKKVVYLAGPIAEAESLEDAKFGWRSEFSDIVERWYRTTDRSIEILSPMRGKFCSQTAVPQDGWERSFLQPRVILDRSLFDVMRADFVLVYLKGFKGTSYGTAMEVAWAYNMQKCIILVNDGPVHPMIDEAATFRLKNLDDAFFAILTMVNNKI